MKYLIQDPKKLSETLFSLRERFSSIDILANPYFQLVKPTPENLKKYLRISKNDKMQFSLTLISFLPSLLQNFTVNLAHCFLYSSESRQLKHLKITKSEWLLISHFTEAAYQNQHDLFFHTISEKLSSRQLSNSTYLLNHSTQGYSKINSWLKQTKPNQTILNSRSVSLFSFFTIFLSQSKIALKLLWGALTQSETCINERTLLISGAKYQTHRETLVNIMLGKNVRNLAQKLKTRNVIFTFEGHAYELYLRRILCEKSLPRKFYFYQHAPVVPSQFGLIKMCSLMSEIDQVFASGHCTMSFLQKHLSSISSSVLVLGSPKYVSNNEGDHTYDLLESPKNQILLAPEGTKDSIFEFFALGKYLAERLPEENFRIRIHPAVKLSDLDVADYFDSISSNFSISANELTSDLSLSKVCLFRSSAVGVEGLAFGVIPIHWGFLNDVSLNPLYLCDKEYIGFTRLEEIYAFIRDIFTKGELESRKNLQVKDLNHLNYFSEFNSAIVLN